MHPVTTTLPFEAMASPMAPSDSCLALSRKPQVLTITRSAPSCLRASSYPSARRRVMIRSESTSALGHPRDTKLTLGAAASRMPILMLGIDGLELVPFGRKYKGLRLGPAWAKQAWPGFRVNDAR